MTNGLLCLVLAAGEAKRFGANKCLTPLGGRPLLAHVVERAQGIAPTYVAVGAYARENQQALQQVDVQPGIIDCPQWHRGPGATIAHCANHLPDSLGLLILLADQYAVAEQDLLRLVALWQQAPDRAACAEYDGTIGVPAIFPATARDRLRNIPAKAGAKGLLKQMAQVQTTSMPNAAWDIDTPADLQHLAAYWQRQHIH